MGECIECGCAITEEEFWDNDGVCHECAEEDVFDHLHIYVISGWRELDEELISCPDEDRAMIVYDQTNPCYRRPKAA